VSVKGILTATAAAAVTFSVALAAHAAPLPAAASYELEPDPLTPGIVSTSPTVTVKTGTTVDDFTFDILNDYNTSSTGLFFEFPAYGLAITSADMTLYSGTPADPGSEIVDTGTFDPSTTTKTLGSTLTSGDYFVQSSVTVPQGATGAFSIAATVSAAPEPASWVLMIVGIGGIGLAFRRKQEFSTPVQFA
jgi:hypothetical protein